MRFVVDSMLGKLARWLRILGYDTRYQRVFEAELIEKLLKADYRLITRHKDTADQYMNAILLRSDNVGEQLVELKERLHLAPECSNWFSRCLICNVILIKTQIEEARENVPEYVFYQNMAGIRHCPTCGRYYWPGSHRRRMLVQLENWGFSESD